jgi:hypothetical protein
MVENNVIVGWSLEILDVAVRPQVHESSVITGKEFSYLVICIFSEIVIL